MGEAKRRSRSQAEILRAASRCIYCPSTSVTTIDHMPPRSLFAQRDRPSGWEFPCCDRCNSGTRGADAVAQFMAKLEIIHQNEWKIESISKLRGALEKYAPGVLQEMFGQQNWSDVFVERNGLIYRSKSVQANGEETKKYLDIFSAKAAMATFCNFTGRPLEMDSFIYSEWYLNAGMSPESYKAIVRIMPMHDQLEQGKKKSGDQFSLRYNTNKKDIVAALLSFHNSLHINVITSDSPEFTGPLNEIFSDISPQRRPTFNVTRAGLLELDDRQGVTETTRQ